MSNQLTVKAGTMIDGFRQELLPIVQEAGQSFDRLKSTFLIAVQQNPDILECSEASIRREIQKCASDGLVPDNKEAAMIPYKKEIQYQPMVYGIIKRMKELGGVFSIVCNLVYENDEFVVNEADPDSLVHKADRFSKDRGPIVGGYAIFRDDQKRLMHLEIMSLEDFEKVRKASKAPNSPAWRDWKEEMYKKAVLRRGAKYISINNDKIRQLIERQDALFDFSERPAAERVDPFSGATIDGEVVEAREQQEPRHKGQEAARKPEEGKVKELPSTPPAFPADFDLLPGDVDTLKECAEKVLGIALLPDMDAGTRRGVLKEAAPLWKEKLPEYIHPLLKSMIEMTDWAIKRDAEGLGWAGEHAMFVHKAKELLGVEKLNVGKYP